jgi:hypothetical protein
MTDMGLKFLQLQEDMRSHRMQESLKQQEIHENVRSHKQQEATARRNLDVVARGQDVSYKNAKLSAGASKYAADMQYAYNMNYLAELSEHNDVTEKLDDRRVAVSEGNLMNDTLLRLHKEVVDLENIATKRAELMDQLGSSGMVYASNAWGNQASETASLRIVPGSSKQASAWSGLTGFNLIGGIQSFLDMFHINVKR